ncbi:MAG TPA: hypothetical protein VGG44_08395, partial [Tepidisphaeraceae bacterium]
MVFTTQCPQCGKILWFASNLTGKQTICPACGAVMRLTPPADAPVDPTPPPPPTETPVPAPATSPDFTQAEAPPDEQPPPVVEESYLTHQVAAAMGDVHVEMEESDVVQWTVQSSGPPAGTPPPESPPAAPTGPPVWAPAPLSNYGQSQESAGSQGNWPGAPASRIDSLLPRSSARSPEEELQRRRAIIWGTGAVAIVALIIAVLWLLRGAPVTPPTWEQANREQILTLKQQAEQ